MPQTRKNNILAPYIVKAIALADLAVATSGGLGIPFATQSEASRERMRFYQARKAHALHAPDEVTNLLSVETKIVETEKGWELQMVKAGKYLFEGKITSLLTGKLIDTASLADASEIRLAPSKIADEMEVLAQMWEEEEWSNPTVTPAKREEEMKRRMKEGLFV